VSRALAFLSLGLALMLVAGEGCGERQAGRPPGGVATGGAATPTASPGNVQLVPPTFRQIDLGSSGLPAPSSISALRGSAPVHIAIPAIGVDSALGQVDLRSDGTLAAPPQAEHPGWYRRGPSPGQIGPAVIVGHLDSTTGPAVFYRLSSLRPGDLIEVGREDGSVVRFKVQRLATYSTDGFSTGEVYGPTSAPELRLITCGGSFSLSRRQYLANVVAFASLAG
jgi:hypothetical protein